MHNVDNLQIQIYLVTTSCQEIKPNENRENSGHSPYLHCYVNIERYYYTHARIARIIAPGYPHHITQRGNNRAMVFFDDEDRQTYLSCWQVTRGNIMYRYGPIA